MRFSSRPSWAVYLRDGYRVAIVGKPNAGQIESAKSDLAAKRRPSSQRSPEPPATYLREQINIDGLAVELIDTAGLRDNPDRIEKEGIRRAREAMKNADAVLWIQDATEQDAETGNR